MTGSPPGLPPRDAAMDPRQPQVFFRFFGRSDVALPEELLTALQELGVDGAAGAVAPCEQKMPLGSKMVLC